MAKEKNSRNVETRDDAGMRLYRSLRDRGRAASDFYDQWPDPEEQTAPEGSPEK